jgi:hypothetical protein
MNSRERVLAVLEGRLPDRVPFGEFAVDGDTVARILGHETYLRSKAKCQIAFWEGRHEEVAQSWREDHIALHRKLDLDIVTFPMATWYIPPRSDEPPPRQVDRTTWEDRQGRIFKLSEATQDITCIHDPVADARRYTVEDFTARWTPQPLDPLSRSVLDAVMGAFAGEKFICGIDGGEVGMVLPGGFERGLPILVESPEIIEAAVAQAVEQAEAADAVRLDPRQDGVLWGCDFGFKTGPFMSPRMFRRFYHAANRRRVESLHRRGLKVMKHCCGNTWSLLDQFCEIGYDCYQSIQPTADMDIVEVKRRYGERLSLWGGVAVEKLVSGTPDEVRADVRRAMTACKPGGRFILGSSHSIAVGTRYDNFLAMLDEYRRLRDY